MSIFMRKNDNKNNNAVCGGVTDNTDYNATKVINSDKLIFFETVFFRWADYVYKERSYKFVMTKSESEVYTISEGYREELKCETDAEFAAKLNVLIKNYNLAAANGIDRKTAGLPYEFAPMYLEARYASGERIHFVTDNVPDAEWTEAVLELFAKEFGNHGIMDLLPPKEDSAMTRFSIEYTFGDIRYSYGEIMVPATTHAKKRSLADLAENGFDEEEYVKKVYSNPWDRTGKSSRKDERRANPTEDYYAGLQQIVESTELRKIQNGKIFPGGFDYEKTPQYYEFYIEYLSGRTMSAFSDEPSECEKFKPIAEQFSKYFEDYLEKNKD